MILEKDSSVLGYPGETSRALDADHHTVCKYDGPQDPNYINVRNALSSIVCKVLARPAFEQRNQSAPPDSYDLKSLLAVTESPDLDYIFYRDQWVAGTNNWITEDKRYLQWLDTSNSASALLWIHGGPATGKSVLSSYVINSLVENGRSCQYFFLRYGAKQKRSLSMLLRSIACQAVETMPDLLSRIIQLKNEAIDFETADARTIWERIFKAILFTYENAQRLYWVLDGLDEADDPQAIVKLVSEVYMSRVPIRVLLVSRPTTQIEAKLKIMPSDLAVDVIPIEAYEQDLHLYATQELRATGNAEYREDLVTRILKASEGNFLVRSVSLSSKRADCIVGTTCCGKIK